MLKVSSDVPPGATALTEMLVETTVTLLGLVVVTPPRFRVLVPVLLIV